MDDLGNRTTVNVRDGNDLNCVVDNLTSRYNSVGDANLSYDNAGNLTADKDGYEYQYDYENRIVKITKDGNDIAESACEGRTRRSGTDRQEMQKTKLSVLAIASVVATMVGYIAIFSSWYCEGLYPFLDPAFGFCAAYFPFASIGWGIAAIVQNCISERRLWGLGVVSIVLTLPWLLFIESVGFLIETFYGRG